MARISYVDPATITDPEIRGWLDEAVRAGRPGTRKSGDSRASTQRVVSNNTNVVRGRLLAWDRCRHC
jgi:hypothetical protein